MTDRSRAVNRARRAADRLLNRLTVPPAGTPAGPLVVAKVATVAPGAAADGNAAVTVTWRGDTYKASYLSQYTPVVNHVVLCHYNGAQLAILGRLTGTPTEA